MDLIKALHRTHYAELVFFHLVRSTGHVVHSVVSVARNIDAPFFILWWAQCRFNEK
jgi:hypothetical protein